MTYTLNVITSKFRLIISILEYFVFFYKQKTAYEMRISDWSSDVCSSDPTSSFQGHIETLSRLFCTEHTRAVYPAESREVAGEVPVRLLPFARIDRKSVV